MVRPMAARVKPADVRLSSPDTPVETDIVFGIMTAMAARLSTRAGLERYPIGAGLRYNARFGNTAETRT